MRTGAQTRTGVLIPGLSSVRPTTTLSRQAKQRLKWVDYYHAHGSNARLTSRHFGIAHRTFYRYYNRFKKQSLTGLENRSQRPNKVRQPTTPRPVIDAIKQLRKANPEFSKYKLGHYSEAGLRLLGQCLNCWPSYLSLPSVFYSASQTQEAP